MGIGAGIVLIAIGAILTFALEARVGFVDIDVVGWILMAAGALGLIMATLVWGPRRRAVVHREPGGYVEERTDVPPPDTRF